MSDAVEELAAEVAHLSDGIHELAELIERTVAALESANRIAVARG